MNSEEAKQRVLDRLWELVDHLVDEAMLEADMQAINQDALEGLVRASSQAAVNYRYHATTLI